MNIFKVNGRFKLIPLIVSILLPLGGGFLVGFLTSNSRELYGELTKAPFFPPAIVFPIVWTILYILMGIASYRIYMIRDEGKNVGSALFFYLVQLLLNFLWSFVFFSFRLYGLSFIVLIVLLIFIIITFVKFLKVDKVAGFLLIPYILWVAFAGFLNFYIWMKNEM